MKIPVIVRVYMVHAKGRMKTIWRRLFRRHLVIGRGTLGKRPTVHVYGNTTSCVRIGQWCSIAPGVTFVLGGEHQLEAMTTAPLSVLWSDSSAHSLPAQGIVVENDVWIGTNALILDGVRIGNGAVVGAGAVVARDVEPYSIVVGNPARHLRYRCDSATRERLLASRWWDQSDEWIREHMTELTKAGGK